MHQASKHISSHTFQIGSVNPSTQIDRSRSVNSSVCLTLRPHGLKLTRLLCPWNSPGKDTGVGSHSLLQGIFLIQRWNLGLLHCRQILHHLSHQGSPWILVWVAYPFSRGNSWPRSQSRVSFNEGGFFTSWTTQEAPNTHIHDWKHKSA